MATTPYFVVSPNTILSTIGLLHGPDKTVPTPAEDWRDATVQVVIPALNEEHNITMCLSSIARQTLQPKHIILIDDGSTDRTIEFARNFCSSNAMHITTIHRHESIGKTPTLKRQSREFDADVEFVLDADTVLVSDNYIERTVQELYKAVGAASACGTILPLRDKDRKAVLGRPDMQRFCSLRPDIPCYPSTSLPGRLRRGVTNFYRDALYVFLQRFVYHGQMVFFGSIVSPVGCAVAYRRKYIEDLFDKYEPIFGDDLTNSEDIFIGFALINEGYRNIQVMDVYARSEEPDALRLPGQIYLWSSSFLQSCYYFDDLLRSPFKALKRRRHHKEIEKRHRRETDEHRKIQEPYRQRFGEQYTREFGRPMGWTILMSAAEKVAFPTVMLIMLMLGMWEPLGITLLAETVLSVGILTIVSKGRRLQYMAKGILVTPLRYFFLLFDLVTMARFVFDIWIRREKKWRK